MKRIQSACLEQTIHFQLKEDLGHDEAVKEVQAELEHYKEVLKRKRVQHKITAETVQPDGSILIKIMRQYNAYDCGSYLNQMV